jgi:hypothetical protein
LEEQAAQRERLTNDLLEITSTVMGNEKRKLNETDHES